MSRLSRFGALLGLVLVAFPWIPHGCTRCTRGVELWVVVLAGACWGLVSVCLSQGWILRASVLAASLATGHLSVVLAVPAKACLPCLLCLLAGWGMLAGCLRAIGRPRAQALALGMGLAAGLLGAVGLRGIGFSASKAPVWHRWDSQVLKPRT